MSSIVIITTLPTPREQRKRLNDVVLRILRQHSKLIVRDWREGWVGWEYKGRPAGAPRFVSFDAFQGTANPTDTGAELVIKNNAKDWRTNTRTYADFIHRAGTTELEWVKVRRRQVDTVDRALLDALAAAPAEPGPRSRRVVGARGGGVTVTAGLVL